MRATMARRLADPAVRGDESGWGESASSSPTGHRSALGSSRSRTGPGERSTSPKDRLGAALGLARTLASRACTSSQGGTDDGFSRVYVGEADDLGPAPSTSRPWIQGLLDAGGGIHEQGRERQQGSRPVPRVSLGRPRPDGKARATRERRHAGHPIALGVRPSRGRVFLEDMLLIYPLLGIDAFTPAPGQGRSGATQTPPQGQGDRRARPGSAEGFIVFSGSHASATESKAIHAYVRR